jgi:acyl-CoA reductase-like NAD-dependent aldehyde dehydrogenase
MTETLTHFIGGKQISAPGALESTNPSNTNEIVAKFPDGKVEDVNDAVAAARSAFPGWSGSSPEVRADLLDKIGSMIIERKDALGKLLATEEGKTLPEATGETVRAGRIFKYFAGEALRRHGQNLESVRPGVEIQTYREAVGVYGLITPWNFPIAIPAWKIAPALAFGNTVVLKSANPTPAVAHALVSIIHEAGAPAGIANLVLGRGIIGDALSKHPDVNGVSFTGSQTVGAKVANAALSHFARVQMEMGGKNPLVVLDDAELDRAIQIAVDGGYFATGQRCTASSRVFVQAGIYDKFVEGVAARAKALKVGNAMDSTTQMGPAVTDTQLAGNLKYVDIAIKEGGRLLAGGAEPLKLATPGHYMSPTLIVDTKIGDTINQEEVFGPVVSVVKIKDYEEGLAHSNSGNFGLSAGIVTTSLKHARHYQRNVKAGMVMINLPTAGVDYHVPFGGSRGSSYGNREQGFAAVEFFTQIKTAYSLS